MSGWLERCACGHVFRDHDDDGTCMERDRFLPCGCENYRPTEPAT